jgi:hypothetical protein
MNLFTAVVRDVGITLIAFVLGCLALPYLNRFCKLMFTQLWMYLLVYLFGHCVIWYQRGHQLPLNNQFVMNSHMILETFLIMLACIYSFQSTWKKKLAIVFLLLFLVIWLLHVLINGIFQYSHYSDLCACFIISATAILVLYEAFLKADKVWFKQPHVYICIGLLAYYASSIPYIALMGYLAKYYPALNEHLYVVINGILANVRYAGVAIAFWLARKNSLAPAYE